MTGRIKGRIRHSFCSDIHLQDLKLGGSIQKTIRQLGQAVDGKVPGEAENKQQCETAYVLHSLTKTRLVYMQQVRDLYIIHVHTKYRGSEHAGHQL